ncbi:RNA polymerase sigma factor [Niabella insulamsoli]|uniref:RNA polymerase sigma factor n=1 Tax=Niabella insulamsoli TaxID=3144874 RepID=UPI0031FC987C
MYQNIITLAAYKSIYLHSDQHYIISLKSHDSQKITEIYQKFSPGIKTYLLSKGADIDEAGDIFQEAVIDLYKLAKNDNFVLTCPLEAFLLLICKRRWINVVEKSKRRGVTKPIDEGYASTADDSAAEALMATFEDEQLVVEMLQKISERCREIIVASYTEKSQQQLAAQMGVSYAYLRKKKSVCMAELIALVRNKKSRLV